ncbi:MAG: hypothetical protein QM687_05750 [Ferruginibacter sp.]
MKKLIALTMILAAFGVTASAQVERKIDTSKRARMMDKHRGGMDKEMLKGVNLTDAQKEQLKKDRQSAKSQMDAIRNDASLSDAQKQEKIKALKEQQKQNMQALLTPEQKKQIQDNRAAAGTKGDRKDKAKDMMHDRKDMYKELNLTEDQKSKMKTQQAETRSKIEAVRNNTSLTEDQKKAQVKEIMKSAQASQKDILTAEQQAKMKELRKDKKHDGKNKRKAPVATS